MNLLVTGIGGPTPRSIAASLRRSMSDVRVVGADCNPRALGFFMPGLVDERVVLPRSDKGDEYFDALHELIEKEQIDYAIVQPESEVLAWGEWFERNGEFPCPVVIPPAVYTRSLVNKGVMADLLAGTDYIPKTVRIMSDAYDTAQIEELVGYPCWIRASTGSGGFGSMKINGEKDLDAWLLVQSGIEEFTVSEFLPGKHLANQMLYLEGKLQLNAGLECVEYVMADVAPSKVTGNTAFGRLLNDPRLLSFCEEVMDFIGERLDVPPHGVFSFDLKLDAAGNPKVTEINIRHMAYTGILARCGCDFTKASLDYLISGEILAEPVRYRFDEDYVFLRDVDVEPIVLRQSELLV